MQYVIEYQLLPIPGRQHPITRVMIMPADTIGEAMLAFEAEMVLGPDCVKVTITEVTEQDNDRQHRTDHAADVCDGR